MAAMRCRVTQAKDTETLGPLSAGSDSCCVTWSSLENYVLLRIYLFLDEDQKKLLHGEARLAASQCMNDARTVTSGVRVLVSVSIYILQTRWNLSDYRMLYRGLKTSDVNYCQNWTVL